MSDFTDYEAKFHEWDFSAANGVRVGPRPVANTDQGTVNRVLYIAVDGSGDGQSIGNPASLAGGTNVAVAGDLLLLRGGVYTLADTNTNWWMKGGTAGNPVIYESYPGEIAILEPNLSDRPADGSGPISRLYLNEDYTHLRKIISREFAGAGVSVRASNCEVHGVWAYNNRHTGIEVYNNSADYPPDYTGEFSSYNIVQDCIGTDNSDIMYASAGGNADGIAAVNGIGNVIRYCEAAGNSDDGFDLWQSTDNIIEYCVSWGNGLGVGSGVGFKMGGPVPSTTNTARRCLSYSNAGSGFVANSTELMQILECSTLNNGDRGYYTDVDSTVQKSCATDTATTDGTFIDNSWNRAGMMAYVSEVPYSAGFMVPVAGFDDIGAMSVALTNPQNTPEPDGATLTIESNSDLGTLYSYSKTTPFNGTEAEKAAEIMANGFPQVPVVGTNTRVVTGQDPLTDHYAGWVQDSDGYGGDMVLVFNMGADETLTIPGGSGTYLFDIDWGDGTEETGLTTQGAGPHTYTDAIEAQVTIKGTFPHLNFNNGGEVAKLISAPNRGEVGNTSYQGMYYGAVNCTSFVSQVGGDDRVTNYSAALQGCAAATAIDIWKIDTSIATTLNSTLRGLTAMGQMDGAIDKWSVPLLTDASNMLEGSALTTECLDRTYTSWGAQAAAGNVQNDVVAHFGSSSYTITGTEGKRKLLEKGWTITDAGATNAYWLQGNGTRYIDIPAFAIASGNDVRVSWEGIFQTAEHWSVSDTAATSGIAQLGTTFQVFNAATGGVAATHGLTAGQYYTAEVSIVSGNAAITVNGTELATGAQAQTGWSLNRLTGLTTGKFLPASAGMQNIQIENLTTGDYIEYKINEGAGTTVYAYDRNGDVIPAYPSPEFAPLAADWQDDGWIWSQSTPTVVYNVPDPMGGNTAMRYTLTGARCILQHSPIFVPEGQHYQHKVWMRAVGGVLGGSVSFRQPTGGASFISVTDEWQQFETLVAGPTSTGNSIQWYLDANTQTVGQVYEVAFPECNVHSEGTITPDADWQLEDLS